MRSEKIGRSESDYDSCVRVDESGLCFSGSDLLLLAALGGRMCDAAYLCLTGRSTLVDRACKTSMLTTLVLTTNGTLGQPPRVLWMSAVSVCHSNIVDKAPWTPLSLSNANPMNPPRWAMTAY